MELYNEIYNTRNTYCNICIPANFFFSWNYEECQPGYKLTERRNYNSRLIFRGTANAAYGLVKLNKEPGNITIGEIENKNGKMENINQKINGDNAKIRANGASITIGRISNE